MNKILIVLGLFAFTAQPMFSQGFSVTTPYGQLNRPGTLQTTPAVPAAPTAPGSMEPTPVTPAIPAAPTTPQTTVPRTIPQTIPQTTPPPGGTGITTPYGQFSSP